jgi:hypothetical protein
MKKRAVEQTGLIPRSILRTFERFRQQLFPGADLLVLQEFRISRYQVIVSVKCLVTLILIPLSINFLSKWVFLQPITEYFWNSQQNEIFLNSYQQNRALFDMQNFEEKIYFEFFLQNFDEIPTITNVDFDEQVFPFTSFSQSEETLHTTFMETSVKQKFQQKTLQLALQYNQETIEAISNLFADLLTFSSLVFLFWFMKPQISILKTFLTESIYSLSDTTKSFLLILFTDLLVGFHSPRGWEFFLELLLRHFGLPENRDFIFLFVATFPVLLDTVFKYWIFRSLNKISPSTVATYHTMIE